jgi:hypothetical protein
MKPAALTVGVNKAYNAVVKNTTNQWVIIIIEKSTAAAATRMA